MGLDMEFMNLFSISFRFLFLGCVLTGVSWVIIETMLGKCLQPVLLAVYLIVKQCLTVPVMQIFIGHYYGYTDEWVVANALVTLVVFILNCVIFNYSFPGDFIKVMFCICIAESLCYVFFFPWLVLINWLEGRELLIYGAPFQAADFWIGIFSAASIAIFYRLAGTWMKQFQTYELRHKRILWGVFLIYAVGIQRLSFTDMTDTQVMMFLQYFHLLCVGVISIGLFLFYKRYRRSVLLRRSFLTMRQQLMESHYQAVREQIMGVERYQRLISEQMERIVHMEPGVADHERLESYLDHLRQEYQNIRTGVYCNDWMVDAVLYCQAERARKSGLRFQCSMQGYNRGKIEEEDLVQLLFGLLDWAIRENEQMEGEIRKKNDRMLWGKTETELKLRASVVASTLLIILETGTLGKVRPPKKLIRKYLRKYEGEMRVESTPEMTRFTIGLMRE